MNMEESVEKGQADSANPEMDDRKCSSRTLTILHDKRFHAVTLCLIVLDVLILLSIILIDLDAIPVGGDTEAERANNKETVEQTLHFVGLGLVTLFMIEVVIRIALEGRDFFSDKLDIFDGVIVTISFILDVVFSFLPVNHAVEDGILLIILLRMWRFFKLICSINVCVRKDASVELEKERKARRKAEEESKQLKEELETLKSYKTCAKGKDV